MRAAYKLSARVPGIVVIAFVASMVVTATHANSERVLYSFKGGSDGQWPFAGVVRDDAGNLYGTTQDGGTGCLTGCGTIYKLAPDGSETILYRFKGLSDGAYPLGDLILDQPSESLYGTTSEGGSHTQNCWDGCGTVFRLSSSGQLTTLYLFTGGNDGELPTARLVRDKDNNLYGTASIGGANYVGTIFKLTPKGKFSVLHTFEGGNSACPESRLKRNAQGILYGTAESACTASSGSVFRLDPDGTFTTLFAFDGDGGANPYAGLAKDADGNLYGTTRNGGEGNGVVFKVSPDGNETVLHTFPGGGVKAGNPWSGLMRSRSGKFYGTTEWDGGAGSVFSVTPDGQFSTLYHFHGSDGNNPTADLVEDRKGNLYGTTESGGTYGNGTVFTVKE